MKKILFVSVLIFFLMLSLYFTFNVYMNFYSEPRSFNLSYNNFNGLPERIFQASGLQFYSNMRFANKDMNYTIDSNCDIQKKKDMIWAFEYLENETNLKFYESNELTNWSIDIKCDKEYLKGEMFVAGECGPEEIINTTLFNLISKGKILLLSSSDCFQNVALHELLHVFGFEHSSYESDIMYNITSCKQTLSQEIISELNRLYSIKELPELYFESASLVKRGNYANLDFAIKNSGLKSIDSAKIMLYSGDKEIEKFEFSDLAVGAGKIFSAKNVKVPMFSKSFKLVIISEEELSKENNAAYFSINYG